VELAAAPWLRVLRRPDGSGHCSICLAAGPYLGSIQVRSSNGVILCGSLHHLKLSSCRLHSRLRTNGPEMAPMRRSRRVALVTAKVGHPPPGAPWHSADEVLDCCSCCGADNEAALVAGREVASIKVCLQCALFVNSSDK
jgi:hypothetical protein